MHFRSLDLLTLFLAVLVAAAYAADEVLPTPEISDTAPKSTVHSSKPRTSVVSRRKRINLGEPPTNQRMPPAGSGATGVTSSSPAGAPTSPYGNSD